MFQGYNKVVQFYTYILFEIIFRIGYCKILNIALLYSRSLLFILYVVLQMVTAAMKLKDAYSLEGKL